MKTKEKMKSRRGFTLVELVVVIAVLAILAGVGAVAYRGYITRAQEAKDMEILAAVKTAVEAAYAEENYTITNIRVTTESDGALNNPEVSYISDKTYQNIPISPDQLKLYQEFMTGNEGAKLSKIGTYTWSSSDDKWTVPDGK